MSCFYVFPISFKGICLRQAYISSLDSHCLSLTTTVSFPPRDHLSPPSSQYPVKSGDAFVYWVSSKPAFLTLYISQLSFPLRSTPPRPFPSAVLYFLLTDDSCLDQHSLRETRGAKDIFIEKLRRHDSSNLTVTMGNAERRI